MMESLEIIPMKRWKIFLACAVPFFILLLPLLFGTQVFAGHDTRFYPYFTFYHNAIKNGESFLWNPYNYSGFPIFVSITGGFLSPLLYAVLRYVPPLLAYHWIIFFDLALAAFFTALLLRAFKIPALAGIIAGMVFVFSQWKWIDDIGIANAIMLLPLFLFLVFRMYERKRWSVLFLALAVAHGILSANFHYVVEGLFAAFLFALFLIGFDEKAETFSFRSWRPHIRVALWFIAGVSGGIILTLYQIIPTAVYTALSTGRAAIPHWEAVTDGIHLGDIPKLLLPYFDTWLIPSSLDTFYIGILPLLFLVGAFFMKKRHLMIFFTSLFVMSVLLAFNNSWLFWVLHHVPPFELLHLSFRWMFVAWFAAAVLIGWAIGEFVKGGTVLYGSVIARVLKILFFSIAGISLFISTVLGFFENNILAFLKKYFTDYLYAGTSHLPLIHYYQYIDRLFAETKSLIFILNPAFFISLFCILIGWFVWQKMISHRGDRTHFLKWMYAFTVLNFLLVWPFYDRTFESKIFARQPATVSFVEQDKHEGRTLTFLKGATEFEKLFVPSDSKPTSPRDQFILNAEMFFANTNMLYGIASAEIYEPLMSRRMAELVSLLGSELVWTGDKLARTVGSPEEKATILASRQNILNFLNIRYIASAYPLNTSHFKKVFETSIIPPYNIPIAVYENESARPLFYLASSIETIRENESAAFEKAKTIPKDGRGVFVECKDDSAVLPCVGNDMARYGFNGRGTVTVKEKSNTVSKVSTISKTSQLLVFSENNLPGWKAYVDGEEQPLLTVGSVYMGVAVPPGDHTVTFTFTYQNIIEAALKLVQKRFGL